MASRTYTVVKQQDIVYLQNITLDAEVSQNDTITVAEFDSSQELKSLLVVNKSSGAEITATSSLNVITITGSCTNADVRIFVVGVKPQ